MIMFKLSELYQIEDALKTSECLTSYEIFQALKELRLYGVCTLRDLGSVEAKLARLPFVKVRPVGRGHLSLERW